MTTLNLETEATRVAQLIIKSLTDLGNAWKTLDGNLVTVRFSSVELGDLLGATWAICEVDCQRLPRRVTARDLTKDETIHHLQTVVGHPIRCLNSIGVVYCVQLTPRPPAPRLPAHIPLDLSAPRDELSVPLGIGRDGGVWRNLPALGHTLITGASGSGKSNWLHAALAALLTRAGPDKLRVALIDPKVSEFAAWSAAPHLFGKVATDEASAARLLTDLVDELDRRGGLLAGRLCRDLAAYNQQAAVKLPYLLVIFDEVLDLILAAGGEKSGLARLLTRLAVKGRSAGILVWVASQHARFDLLPRAVSVNLATRLVFRVSDVQAANLAGAPGAQTIPRSRPGRFLARIEEGAPVEVQAFQLDDQALHAVASAVTGADLAPAETLSAVEITLVRYALENLGGAFTIGKLDGVIPGLKRHELTKTAKRWELLGWLTAPPSIIEPRRVTPGLAALAGLAPTDTHQAPKQASKGRVSPV